MLWGIPGVLAGALLATCLGAGILWPLGGIALGLGVFLLRKVLPFSFEATIIATAVSLSLLTVVLAYWVTRPEK